MLTYKDRAFCSEKTCANKNYPRIITDEVWENAKQWWGGEDAQILQAHFRDTPECEGYIPKDVWDGNITPYLGAEYAK